MHVDWNWIKQRPQFLANELDKFYNVKVLYSWSFKRSNLTHNKDNIDKKPMFPSLFGKGKFLNLIATLINSIIVNTKITLFNPEYIWITHPKMYKYISEENKKKKSLIYDCMDDVLGFDDFQDSFKELEEQLVKDSKVVLCSSQNLIDTLNKRYNNLNIDEKVYLMRNGIGNLSDSLIAKGKNANKSMSSHINLYYIGTVESWIDFKLLDKLLRKYRNIHLHIVGPYRSKYEFESTNCTYHGAKKHAELFEDFSIYDALIMPFKLNELILSVDPVKLYEYLIFNKPVISISYKEVDRFKEYIYLYNNEDELDNIFKELSCGALKPKSEYEKSIQFLEKNTWSVRAEEINNLLLGVRSTNNGSF